MKGSKSLNLYAILNPPRSSSFIYTATYGTTKDKNTKVKDFSQNQL